MHTWRPKAPIKFCFKLLCLWTVFSDRSKPFVIVCLHLPGFLLRRQRWWPSGFLSLACAESSHKSPPPPDLKVRGGGAAVVEICFSSSKGWAHTCQQPGWKKSSVPGSTTFLVLWQDLTEYQRHQRSEQEHVTGPILLRNSEWQTHFYRLITPLAAARLRWPVGCPPLLPFSSTTCA